jgi:hypothetical protein
MLDIYDNFMYIITDTLKGYHSKKNLNLEKDSLRARFFISFLPCPKIY